MTDAEYTPIETPITKDTLAATLETATAASGKGRGRRVWEYLSGALTDAKTGKAVLSIGRLSWLVWFIQATYLWQRANPGVDPISSSQLIIGGSLLAYITGATIKEVLVARIANGAKG